MPTDADLERVFRVEVPRVRARLVREFRDFDLAAELTQDAVVRALERWPTDGVPRNPAAWLTTVARNLAFDGFRRNEVRGRAAAALRGDAGGPTEPAATFDDDLLRLIFTCCHPALELQIQAALTLRTVVGLSLEQVARAFLVAPRTLEQRLVRAKRKIREAGIAYEIPEEHRLPERMKAVCTVVYLIFNEGYAATDGDQLQRRDLCTEAIRLMREVNRLLRGRTSRSGHARRQRAEAIALLSLMLLQDSRAQARVDDRGRMVLLEQQDRSRWDRRKIQEGTALLDVALALRADVGPFQLQAAIASLHANSAPAETDWPQIARLYERLITLTDTSVIRLNHAVAVFMSGAQARGLALARALGRDTRMQSYPHYHTAMAGLERLAGDRGASIRSYRAALEYVANTTERRFIEDRIAELSEAPSAPS